MNTIKTQHIMQKIFTKEFMQDNCGCYSLFRLKACSFMKSDIITLQSIVDSEISLKDKYWFICKKLATKEQNQQIAIDVATIVLPLYERRYRDDLRPRDAIEAAKAFIAGHISKADLIAKRRAAADDAAADDDDAIKEQLLSYLKNFINEHD